MHNRVTTNIELRIIKKRKTIFFEVLHESPRAHLWTDDSSKNGQNQNAEFRVLYFCFFFFVWVWNLVADIEGGTWAEGVGEEGVEKNIWA
jgi:hypothetical protein